jgi:hypothetical protein
VVFAQFLNFYKVITSNLVAACLDGALHIKRNMMADGVHPGQGSLHHLQWRCKVRHC